ncbi:ABC-type polysaccharide/polyol phosphate export systems, permease component [Rivularia sp. PCC 7116]|uniref:ABC transporter permease n=1 Tax=Rivularia sp. PCC 7116 TaxID=373994 RepID=UPI00029F1E2E|nr:ABC transporter permease [Rivularia sp. PCC 7116]AFY57742.1 ABC-type polysaccharide/polyol phosphate export systems, permease component [Rivularia sp. PCC 7116]
MLKLFFAELRCSWIEFRRYPIESISQIVIVSTIFYGLFLGAGYIVGSNLQLGDRLDSIVVGYVLWILVNFVMTNIAGKIQYEAQTGTLEQLFLSRYSAVKVFLMRGLAYLTLEILKIILIIFIIIALTGSSLYFPPVLVLPFICVLLGAYGFAFIIGSLALILKRVQQLIPLLLFPLLFLLTIPTETWTGNPKLFAQLIPMTPGAGLLRDLMARGEALNLATLSIAFINGIIYFTIGLLLFRFAEKEAKRKGILSGY